MKKLLSVFLAVLMVFSFMSIAVYAEDESAPETTTVVEEKTTRNIMNEDGLVFPDNTNQLKQSIIFKIFEKIIKFILSLFGQDAGNVDQGAADGVSDAVGGIDEILSELFG